MANGQERSQSAKRVSLHEFYRVPVSNMKHACVNIYPFIKKLSVTFWNIWSMEKLIKRGFILETRQLTLVTMAINLLETV